MQSYCQFKQQMKIGRWMDNFGLKKKKLKHSFQILLFY